MVVVDTHVLVWWVSGDKSLSKPASKAIKGALVSGSEVVISSISAWEIAMLIEKERLTLTMDVDSWLDEVAQIDGVRFMPIDNEITVKSTMLPGKFHKDPADRMIVATARKLAVPLITADNKIRAYKHVKTIW
ncbi:MAG: VapC toxin family PIN domain ribonuclease [Gammaproteobacteria bacterium]|nr:MAG: VapC toxin family PIN domain ribonuclease [Gammaproteobacteria bacterium]RLA44789.1 MAG: VapC toxin family PIN domain ribonuclease [Gammaproteobacteria bacterium]